MKKSRPSTIGGIDFSGTVIESSNPRLKKGDAVLTTGGEYIGVSHDGGYSPYARVQGEWISRVPQGLTLWEAMAFGTAGYTAGIAHVGELPSIRASPAASIAACASS